MMERLSGIYWWRDGLIDIDCRQGFHGHSIWGNVRVQGIREGTDISLWTAVLMCGWQHQATH